MTDANLIALLRKSRAYIAEKLFEEAPRLSAEQATEDLSAIDEALARIDAGGQS